MRRTRKRNRGDSRPDQGRNRGRRGPNRKGTQTGARKSKGPSPRLSDRPRREQDRCDNCEKPKSQFRCSEGYLALLDRRRRRRSPPPPRSRAGPPPRSADAPWGRKTAGAPAGPLVRAPVHRPLPALGLQALPLRAPAHDDGDGQGAGPAVRGRRLARVRRIARRSRGLSQRDDGAPNPRDDPRRRPRRRDGAGAAGAEVRSRRGEVDPTATLGGGRRQFRPLPPLEASSEVDPAAVEADAGARPHRLDDLGAQGADRRLSTTNPAGAPPLRRRRRCPRAPPERWLSVPGGAVSR